MKQPHRPSNESQCHPIDQIMKTTEQHHRQTNEKPAETIEKTGLWMARVVVFCIRVRRLPEGSPHRRPGTFWMDSNAFPMDF